MDYSSQHSPTPIPAAATPPPHIRRLVLLSSTPHATPLQLPIATVVRLSSSLRLVFTQMRLQPLLFAAFNQENIFSDSTSDLRSPFFASQNHSDLVLQAARFKQFYVRLNQAERKNNPAVLCAVK